MHPAIDPRVAQLDLSYVANRLIEEGLSAEEAAEAVDQHRKLLTIALANPGVAVAPSHFMDKAIHAHVSHTRLWREHCAILTDGGHIDHDPTIKVGMVELAQAWEVTRAEMNARFGMELPPVDAASCVLETSAASCVLKTAPASCVLETSAASCVLKTAPASCVVMAPASCVLKAAHA